MAQEEIAKNAGLDVDDQEESKGDLTFFLYLELYRLQRSCPFFLEEK